MKLILLNAILGWSCASMMTLSLLQFDSNVWIKLALGLFILNLILAVFRYVQEG